MKRYFQLLIPLIINYFTINNLYFNSNCLNHTSSKITFKIIKKNNLTPKETSRPILIPYDCHIQCIS